MYCNVFLYESTVGDGGDIAHWRIFSNVNLCKSIGEDIIGLNVVS